MKADLHVHSTHSDDGRQTVEEILKRCEELGIGAVAITDHNTLKAHTGEKHEGTNVIIIPAMELTTEDGHVLAYGLTEEIPRGLTANETIQRIHAVEGIAIAPHAYRLWSGLGEDNIRSNHFDAIETINGRSRKGANNKAKRLAKELGLPGVGGSDAHNVASIGRACTEVPDDCRTPGEIIKAIKDNRCEAVGTDLSSSRSVSHGAMTISQWFRRGFKRM
jgi:predicted metal-dependent phosphoesterase TrpH